MTPFAQKIRFTPGLAGVRLAGTARPPVVDEATLRRREREAYDRGRQDAEKNLSEQLLRQRTEYHQLQQGVLESLRQAVPNVVRECEQLLLALAIEAARKVVAGIPVDAERVEAVVREALAQVEESTDYHVYLNPADIALLEKTEAVLEPSNGQAQRIHLHRTPEVAAGGCLVKTHFGVIDAQQETKFELVRKALSA